MTFSAPIAEVQVALTAAISEVTGLKGPELKPRVRTGIVVFTDDRDWDLRHDELSTFFNQSRAIAVDMECATIATNGFRLRVCPTASCCASPTSPCAARSSCPAWPMPSMPNGSASI